ncbi:MAG: helix-turn-helix transcriptional regulator [Patescibacteria group bacterium]|nr:helix-turn-helix transcriptional regulator [Patescibacteria group bacterium]
METVIYSKEHKKLVDRIIQARKSAGLTQLDAARALGKTQSYVSKIERAQRKIDVIELKKLAQIYRKSVGYFL